MKIGSDMVVEAIKEDAAKIDGLDGRSVAADKTLMPPAKSNPPRSAASRYVEVEFLYQFPCYHLSQESDARFKCRPKITFHCS